MINHLLPNSSRDCLIKENQDFISICKDSSPSFIIFALACSHNIHKLSKYLVRNLALSCLLSIALCFTVFAQAPTKQWEKLIGGDNHDTGFAVASTVEGGFLIGGFSNSSIGGSRTATRKGYVDYWVVKVDALGNKLWDKAYGGTINGSQSFLRSVIPTSDGGFLLGGRSSADKSGDKSEDCRGILDYWVVKIDGNGNKLWDKTFGGAEEEELTTLLATSDGGYLLGGTSTSGISGDKTEANRGEKDYWVVKINASGTKQWDKTFGGDKFDEPTSITNTLEGGYLVGGTSQSGLSGDKTQSGTGAYFNYWVIKLTAFGGKEWDKTIGGLNNDNLPADNSRDYLKTVLQTEDGGYLLAGDSNSKPGADKTAQPRDTTLSDPSDYWVVKLSNTGVKQWDKIYGGSSLELLTGMVKSPLGGYVLAGISWSDISGDKSGDTGFGGVEHWMIKISDSGINQWDKSMVGTPIDIMFGFTVNTAGEYALAGYRVSGSMIDYLLIKTTPENISLPPTININFQNSTTIPRKGYLIDYGQAFGIRTGQYQGNGNSYGWKSRASANPIDLSVGGPLPGNGRKRSLPSDELLSTFMHMQGNDVKYFRGTPVEGYWEISVANGSYQVTVSVGDGSVYNMNDLEYHSINIEGVNAINRFVPTGLQGNMSRFKSATVDVVVTDGLLTIDADGGRNTKINYAVIQPLHLTNTAVVEAPLVEFQSNTENRIKASPNPFTDKLTLSTPEFIGEVLLSLQNAMGNVLYQTTRTIQSGEVSLEISIPLSAGVYFVKLTTEDGIQKVVKVIRK